MNPVKDSAKANCKRRGGSLITRSISHRATRISILLWNRANSAMKRQGHCLNWTAVLKVLCGDRRTACNSLLDEVVSKRSDADICSSRNPEWLGDKCRVDLREKASENKNISTFLQDSLTFREVYWSSIPDAIRRLDALHIEHHPGISPRSWENRPLCCR